MACDLTLGRLEPCKDAVGGIKAIYFANYDAAIKTGATIETDEEVSAFASLVTLYKYELRGANHNVEEANEVSADNGTSFWTQTLTAALKKQDAATRKELKLMSYGRPIVIAEDYNGNFKILGFENGCDVSVATSSGSAMGDFSGYNLSIVGTEKEPAHFIDPTIIGDDTNTSVVEGV
jgi:hypothetical protein